MSSTSDAAGQVGRIQQYYQFQSRIYDLTRWSFLFGRSEVIRLFPFDEQDSFHLLEIGCGTGRNLAQAAARFPQARFTGLDVSRDMLDIAGRRFEGNDRVELLEMPYASGQYHWTGRLDAILFSYALTMINPQWESLLHQAAADLKPGGIIAVADFHDSRRPWFKRHMSGHHVRMDAHLTPVLQELFSTHFLSVRRAYFGVWSYFIFVGAKRLSQV